MKRREFIAGLGGVVTWPVVARSQQPQGKAVARVGVLLFETRHRPELWVIS